MNFKEITAKELKLNPITALKQDWGILTCGNLELHNSMTIGWGTIGYLWKKEVLIVFVRPNRYTYKFIEENDDFTVSFYDEKYHEALVKYGTLSGRDYNKDKVCDFHPLEITNKAVSYEEAKIIFVCKKIYEDKFNQDLFLDASIKECYNDQQYHKFYIGEIKKILVKE